MPTFDEILAQVIELLQREGRVVNRMLIGFIPQKTERRTRLSNVDCQLGLEGKRA